MKRRIKQWWYKRPKLHPLSNSDLATTIKLDEARTELARWRRPFGFKAEAWLIGYQDMPRVSGGLWRIDGRL